MRATFKPNLTRAERLQKAQSKAARDGKPIVYDDDDGCEITVMPNGHYFYNMADWY